MTRLGLLSMGGGSITGCRRWVSGLPSRVALDEPDGSYSRRQEQLAPRAGKEGDGGLWIDGQLRSRSSSHGQLGQRQDTGEGAYPEDGDAADDGGVFRRGEGLVGGGDEALGGAARGPVDVHALGRHRGCVRASAGG